MMEPHNYHAYLLRLWRESDHDPWRATLENPHTGERLSFARVGELLAFLCGQLWEATDERPGCNSEGGDSAPGPLASW